MKKTLCFLYFVIVLITKSFSIEDPINITPHSADILHPSPTSSSLGKFGQIPVGYFTGTPNISIPLYEYRTKNLSLPISLSYSSNGVHVDEIASWVGLGWNLNAGGVITRTIRGKADETESREIRKIDPNTITSSLKTYLNDVANGAIETEPDIFAFNFNGYSGKFFLNDNLKPILVTYQDLKISYENTIISITTPDGIIYTFGGEDAIEYSKSSSNGAGCSKLYENEEKTAWYLKSIKHPLGDIINFYYSENGISYYSSVNQDLTVKASLNFGCPSEGGDCPSLPQNKLCYTMINSRVPHLDSISSNYVGTIVFNKAIDRSDSDDSRLENIDLMLGSQKVKTFKLYHSFPHTDGNGNSSLNDNSLSYHMFLDSVQFLDGTGKINNRYTFEYISKSSLAPRLTFKRDHWGYYNGKNNSGLYPYLDEYKSYMEGIGGANREPDHDYAKIGLLQKITYPTGGYNILDWEPNTYYGSVTEYDSKKDFSVSSTGLNLKDFNYTNRYFDLAGYAQIIEISTEIIFTGDESEYNSLHHFGTLEIRRPNGEIIFQVDKIKKGEYKKYYLDICACDYFIKVGAGGSKTTCFVNIKYIQNPPNTYTTNIETGGNRIKRLNAIDNVGKYNIIRFYYGKYNQPEISSANNPVLPEYAHINHVPLFCDGGGVINCEPSEYCSYLTISSNSLLSLYAEGNNPVTYRYVCVSNGENFENGGTQLEFNQSFDTGGNLLFGESFIFGSTKTNWSWDNGTKLSESVLQKKDTVLKILKKTEYKYTNHLQYQQEGLVVKKNYEPKCEFTVCETCTEELQNIVIHTYCGADHKHSYTELPGWEGPRCVAPGSFPVKVYHPCHYLEIGETLCFWRGFDHFSAVNYQIYSFFKTLDKEIVTEYTETNDTIISETNFYYDNEFLTNPTKISRKDGNNRLIEKVIKFPNDYDVNADLVGLKNNNILNKTIDERVQIDGKLVNGRLIRYNYWGQPIEIFVSDVENGSQLPFDRNNPYSYGHKYAEFRYDANKNLIEYLPKTGIKTSYLWDNKYKLYPLAKVENAEPNQIFFQGFEDSNTSLQITNIAKTGNFGGDFQLVDLSVPYGDYKLTYWKRNSEGIWDLFTKNYRGVISINEALTGNIDDIRVAPENSFISTYTYKPLVGLTSVTDPDNFSTYYNYDTFGRLINIKDGNQKLLKDYSYHLNGQEVGIFTGYHKIDKTINSLGEVYLSKEIVKTGEGCLITIIPVTGYHVEDLIINEQSYGGFSEYLLENINQNIKVEVVYDINKYIITNLKIGDGIVTPLLTKEVNHGDSISYHFTPSSGSYIYNVIIDNISFGSITNYTFKDINSNHNIVVEFRKISFIINTSANEGGSFNLINPSVEFDNSIDILIQPNIGYYINRVEKNGVFLNLLEFQRNGFTTTFENVKSNQYLDVNFKIKTFTISASGAAGGSLTPSGITIVNYGSNITYTITPSTGYHIKDVKVNETSVGAVSNYTFSNVTANQTLSVEFEINSYTIATTKNLGGSISPSGNSNVNHGSGITYTFTPSTGYHIKDVKVNGTSVGAVTSYTFSNVAANHTLHVEFEINSYTISATKTAGGTMSPSGNSIVNYGAGITYAFTPSTGYYIKDVMVNGSSVGVKSSYTFTNVTSNHTISVEFEINRYTINVYKIGSGTVFTDGGSTVPHGYSQEYIITPAAGYHIESVTVNGTSVGPVNYYLFSNVTSDQAISVIFKINKYTITTTQTSGGTMSPSGNSTANQGSGVTYTFTPSTGYHIKDVKVNGTSVGAVTSYTFSNVAANHTLHVEFEINSYTISATKTAGGTMSPSGNSIVNYGAGITYAFTPSTGYYIKDVMVNGSSVGVKSSYTFTNVTSNHTISVEFEINRYTINVYKIGSGTVFTDGGSTVPHGYSQEYIITPAAGYHIESVTVNGTSVGPVNYYLFSNVTSDQAISVIFKINKYTITTTQTSGGTMSPAGNSTVNQGSGVTYTFTPSTGYHIKDVKVNENSLGAVTSYTFSNVTENQTLHVEFEINKYTITASKNTGGTMSPAGNTFVNYGSGITYIFTPSTGYRIKDVKVNGTSQGVILSYSFSNVTSNQSIYVEFELDNYINTNLPSIYFVRAGGTKTFTISSNVSWSITKNVSWITITPITGSNSATITVTCVRSIRDRNGVITITGGGITKTVHVIQTDNLQ